jgi:uncharacterized phosphosugar-binding protein
MEEARLQSQRAAKLIQVTAAAASSAQIAQKKSKKLETNWIFRVCLQKKTLCLSGHP